MTLRHAEVRDAAAIAELHVRSRIATYTGLLPERIVHGDVLERRVAQWNERIASGRLVVVAEDAERLLGFGCAGPMPPHPQGREAVPGYDAYLDALYIAPEAHARGLGRAILAVIATELERSYDRLALHVLATNPAVGFYEHLGATRIREEQIRDGDDTWVQYAYGWSQLARLCARVRVGER